MNNNYDGNTAGLGLDGVVNQPNPGFGLPEEQVVESVQPVVSNDDIGMGMPTNEELNEYNNQRAMAPQVDAPVQYAHEIENSKMDRTNNLLDSLKTRDEREAYETEQQMLD